MNSSRRLSASFRYPIEELLPYPKPPDEDELVFSSANPYEDYLRYMQRKAGARADLMEAAIPRPSAAPSGQDGGYAAFMARYGGTPRQTEAKAPTRKPQQMGVSPTWLENTALGGQPQQPQQSDPGNLPASVSRTWLENNALGAQPTSSGGLSSASAPPAEPTGGWLRELWETQAAPAAPGSHMEEAQRRYKEQQQTTEYLANQAVNTLKNMAVSPFTEKDYYAEYDARWKQENDRATTPWEDATIGLPRNLMAGLTNWSGGVANTLDKVVPDQLIPQPVQAFLDRTKAERESWNSYADAYNEEAGIGANAAAIMKGVGGAAPTAAAAFLTGGGAALAEGSKLGGGALSELGTVMNGMVKNPLFWTSLASTYGDSYDEAKARGASDDQASMAALAGSVLNAGIEVGGGIETQFAPGAGHGLEGMLRSALEEGGEELGQNLVTNGINRLVFDQSAPLVSTSDERAVFNPLREANSFLVGGAVGGLMSAPGALLGGQTGQRAGQSQTEQSAGEAAFHAAVETEQENLSGAKELGKSRPGGPVQEMNAVRVLEQETAKGIDTLAAKTQKVAEQASRLPGGQAQELAAMTAPEEYMVSRPLSELEHRAAQWMLEEFKARNQVAYERYDSLTKQEQGIIDRWQALEYRLNPPAALVSGRQNSKLFGRNDPYGIIDTRQAVGYDKGKEGSVNEQSQAGQSWGRPNRTNPGRPNAYAEYLAYKQKVQARQQSLALEQALRELLVQEQAARVAAGPQAFAYKGADGFASSGYETGGAAGTGGTGGLDGSAGADSVSSVGDTDGATGQILSEGGSGAGLNKKLMNELAESGVKYNADDVIMVTKTAEEKLVWLEKGNSSAGYQHILNHADEFATKGITPNQLPDFISSALSKGKIVGMQGTRPIYEVMYNGSLQRVAITVGNNGFIVGANPVSLP